MTGEHIHFVQSISLSSSLEHHFTESCNPEASPFPLGFTIQSPLQYSISSTPQLENREYILGHAFRMKPEMWAKVAEDLQVPWRAAEAMHWEIGKDEMGRRAGIVPFTMAPAGYAPSTSTAGATVGSSSSSASGIEPLAYIDPSAQDVGGRMPSGLRESTGFGRERESGVVGTEGYGHKYREFGAGGEGLKGSEGWGRRKPASGSGSQTVVLPSLAEFEGGVPAYAGFVGEMRGKERRENSREGVEERRSPKEEEDEDVEDG